MLGGVISMPSNIFATTGTNVSILFIDANNDGDVVLVDASALGVMTKEGKNQKTVLSPDEEWLISRTFNSKQPKEDFAVIVSYEKIAEKNFSLSAGQYFDVKVRHTIISGAEFETKLSTHRTNLAYIFKQAREVEDDILKRLGKISHE
jgi:type I restriction enzyme M protein